MMDPHEARALLRLWQAVVCAAITDAAVGVARAKCEEDRVGKSRAAVARACGVTDPGQGARANA